MMAKLQQTGHPSPTHFFTPDGATYSIKISWGVPSARRLGLVDLNFECSTVCPILQKWQRNLAKVAGQLCMMLEHPNQCQPNPGPGADGTPCIILVCPEIVFMDTLYLRYIYFR